MQKIDGREQVRTRARLKYVSDCQAREILYTNVKNKKGWTRYSIQSLRSGEMCHQENEIVGKSTKKF